VVRWAREVKPRIIVVENVEEFASWGPLDENGHPRPEKSGQTFRAWCGKLSDLGYQLDFRLIVAADHGTPTLRRRLFLIARRDRAPIVWPEPTHGPGRAPYRSAAECIDWTLPCPSIFGRRRPLAEATLRRIAAGIDRYVVRSQPFILPVTHQADRCHGVDEPLRTITAAHRGELTLCSPFVVKYHGGERGHLRHQEIDEPLRTVDTARRFALATPFLVRHGHYSKKTGAGIEPGRGAGTFRGQSLEAPLSTVCGTDDKHVVVPLATKLNAAWLTKFYGWAGAPGGGAPGAKLDGPMPTVTAGAGGGHHGLVQAFLLKYYSASGRRQTQRVTDPLHTVTAKARFGLVAIAGENYQIDDIGMRMLVPHELAAAQGFPDWYDLSPAKTKTDQIWLIGNSVCSQVAQAVVTANVGARRAQGHLFTRAAS
jgi:DNA (cytosine-5)-methyltransferase 1